jgi:hypothetical protein
MRLIVIALLGLATARLDAGVSSHWNADHRCDRWQPVVEPIGRRGEDDNGEDDDDPPVVPQVTVQPGNQAVGVGGTVTFTATVLNAANPTFQWQIQIGGVFTDIPGPGATASTYTTPVATVGELGTTTTYSCRVLAGGQTITSAPVTRTVTAGNPQDGLAYLTFTTSPAGGAYAPNHVLAVWLQQGTTFVRTIARYGLIRQGNLTLWDSVQTVDAVAGATFSSHGQKALQFNARTLADGQYTLWIETADANLPTPATGQVAGANRISMPFTITGGSVVEATASGGGFTAIRLSPSVTPLAPAFAAQPTDAVIAVGATATFSVAVTGAPAPTLRWQVSTDGVTFTDIAGPDASGTSYTTAVAATADAGSTRVYRCMATNASSSVASQSATLTVTGVTTDPGTPGGVSQAGIAYVSFTTAPAGGTYRPKHVMAAWIQRGGTFIASVGRWSAERSTSLKLYNSRKSGVDAVLGATQLEHSPKSNVRWQFDQAAVPDGTYTLWLESADENPDPIGAPVPTSVVGANRFSMDFTMTGGLVTLATAAGGGFTAVRIAAASDTAARAEPLASTDRPGELSTCGSGGVFALMLSLGLAAGIRRRRG